jgi:hypothetical protein
VLSASVLFLCLGIGLGWTTVQRFIVRLASYQRGYCEDSFLLEFIFISFMGKGTKLNKIYCVCNLT